MSNRNMQVGETVKQLRNRRGLSLAQVSELTGIAQETLAGIEDLSVAPPLGQMIRLADAFRVTLGELFGDAADAPYCIVRSDSRQSVSRFGAMAGHADGYSYESLGHAKQNRHMEPFLVTLNPSGDAPPEPNQHLGEEILFVLDGEVQVTLSGHTDILRPGDSIYYDSTLPHVVACHGDRPATILAVIYARKEMMIL